MKVFGHTLFGIIISFFLFSQAFGYGSHGDGRIGNFSDRLQLPRGLPIFQNFTAPISYPSFTRGDLQTLTQGKDVIDVEGRSSKLQLFIPVGFQAGFVRINGFSFDWQDRGIQKAIADAKERFRVDLLYDIRIDMNFFTIMGIYNKTTTILNAKGVRLNTDSSEEESP